MQKSRKSAKVKVYTVSAQVFPDGAINGVPFDDNAFTEALLTMRIQTCTCTYLIISYVVSSAQHFHT